MQALTWLMLANAALWLGLGGYLAFMQRTQKNLEKRMALLEGIHD